MATVSTSDGCGATFHRRDPQLFRSIWKQIFEV